MKVVIGAMWGSHDRVWGQHRWQPIQIWRKHLNYYLRKFKSKGGAWIITLSRIPEHARIVGKFRDIYRLAEYHHTWKIGKFRDISLGSRQKSKDCKHVPWPQSDKYFKPRTNKNDLLLIFTLKNTSRPSIIPISFVNNPQEQRTLLQDSASISETNRLFSLYIDV